MARIPHGGASPGRQQVGDAPGQDPGLARARPGDDEQRAAPVLHRGALGQGQVVEQRGGPPGEGARRGGRAPAALAPVVGPARPTASSAPTSASAATVSRPPPSSRPPRAAAAPTRSSAACRPAPGPAAPRGRGHSHSMVPGGFDVTSSATRFTPSTSLMMREAMRSTRS